MWARTARSQAPQRAEQRCRIAYRKVRRKLGKFIMRCGLHQQHRHAAAGKRALHVDRGIADKPDVGAWLDAAWLQGKLDRRAVRFIGMGIARPDDAAEQRRPAEMCGLVAQDGAGLVADDGKIVPAGGKLAQHVGAARERREALQVNRAEAVEIDPLRLFPALAEDKREALAQAEPDPLAGLLERPQR